LNHSLWAVEGSNLAQPSELFVVFERNGAEGGYIIQDTAVGSHWFVRSDGFYNGGWVRNLTVPTGQTLTVGMKTIPTGTTVTVNGEDWTANPNYASGEPGRIAIGGADGRAYDPLPVKIAEIIAYDRELTDGERWQVGQAVAARYQGEGLPVLAPVISPPGDIGTGSVNVSLTTATPGAEIRYTLDGSAPTASSTLYGGTFSVSRGTSIQARAFLAGQPDSEISSEFYGDNSDALPVAGASMWLSADRAVMRDEAGSVSHWGDLTGNGNDVENGTGFAQPTWQSDGIAPASKPAQIVPETTGNVNYGGTLGDYFIVHESIDVTQLGAFDHLADSFDGDVTVQLWGRDDNGTP
jgi:hypothetical protein